MTTLTPNTQLKRISKLDIQLKGNDSIRLKWGRKHLKAELHALAILNAFSQPKTFAAGLLQVAQTENCDEMTLSNTISQLFDAGVLRDVKAVQKKKQGATIAFDSPAIHIEMLNDRTRTDHYLKAIREVVKPGDIVVDLGTGTGVLALAAAQAGASHVYAIEVNKTIAEVAKANFERNGFADKITLCEGRSNDIVLPERADVLVSEIIGDDPFDEQIIELTTDARLRFLKPNAKMIPDRIEIFGLLLAIPQAEFSKYRFSEESISNWNAWYDIDFSALMNMPLPENEPLFNIPPQKTVKWDRFHPPLHLVSIDLKQHSDQRIKQHEVITVQADGLLNGLLIYFEVQLSPKSRLSSHPDKAGQDNHWYSPVWGVVPSINLESGVELSIDYEADSRRNWTYAHVSSLKGVKSG